MYIHIGHVLSTVHPFKLEIQRGAAQIILPAIIGKSSFVSGLRSRLSVLIFESSFRVFEHKPEHASNF